MNGKQRIRDFYRNTAAIVSTDLRVAVYRRISADQAAPCKLIVQYYKELAERNNWILKGVYVDEGQDHTALDKLLDDCRSGEIDFAVVKSTSHISRDMDQLLEIAREFEARSVNVYFESENILGSANLEIHPPDRC